MKNSKLLLSAVLAGVFSASFLLPVAAQTADAQPVDQAVVVDDDRDDDGFDWGLLGLLGLLGLIPRKRNDVVVHRDDTNRTDTSGNNPNRL